MHGAPPITTGFNEIAIDQRQCPVTRRLIQLHTIGICSHANNPASIHQMRPLRGIQLHHIASTARDDNVACIVECNRAATVASDKYALLVSRDGAPRGIMSLIIDDDVPCHGTKVISK